MQVCQWKIRGIDRPTNGISYFIVPSSDTRTPHGLWQLFQCSTISTVVHIGERGNFHRPRRRAVPHFELGNAADKRTR